MLKSIICLLFIQLLHVTPGLKKMREYYGLINRDEKAAISLKDLAKSSPAVPANVSAAYWAAAEMALAQYKFNPGSKLNSFNAGKKALEAALRIDSLDIEVRYIRLTIQQNAPSFLGYNTSISKDRNFLIHHLKLIKADDPELFLSVYAYLLARCKLSELEKTALKS